ncbi:von Willebrand factor type A domain protein [Moritella viscosa]|uniref:nitric oxide reductase activation protein NorD n=1 Tax=Moritella viscosa TaxID=80854 RepID=UPI00091CF2EA|nr:VWA domain-containing protein [Moritella viscosa]SGZ10355.1 von Willebrand factor type A domain protein [Moritella viscosa]
MEEWVGEVWHKLITKRANTEYPDASVSLNSVSSQLAPYFRALGGEHHKVIEATSSLKINFKRSLIQRIAGTHQRTHLCWHDDRSIRLPANMAIFPTKALNQQAYFWLAALSAQLPKINHWFVDNQQATLTLINKRPGLKRLYFTLVNAFIQTRPSIDEFEGKQLAQEQAVRNALLAPGSVDELPYAEKDPYPIFLWLYPMPLSSVTSVASDDDNLEENTTPNQAKKIKGVSKQGHRADDSKETDGLLMFMAESLFTWTEHIDLDRPQEEDLEQDLVGATEDLDFITVAKQRRSNSAKLKFDLDLPAPYTDDLALGDGIKLPEWDYKQGRLKPDFCLLQPMLADDAQPAPVPPELHSTARKLRNQFSILRPQQQWVHRQPFGSELDLDAYMNSVADPNKHSSEQDLYINRSNTFRDLSCLLLADLSMSTDSHINNDQRVIDVIRDSILLFAEALDSAGDPFAIYGFSSIKNKQIRFNLLKNFAEKYTDAARGRILEVKPGFYTRMGASIRQATEVLCTQNTAQRILLIISDGKPNDIDHYEGRYGIEDTRQAVLAAKKRGIQPFCITIDEEANDYLPYLFGDQGYSVISNAASLPTLLPKLYLNLTSLS